MTKKENIGGGENCNLHDIFWSAQVPQPRTDDFLAPTTLLECRKHLIGYKTSGACECNEQCPLQTNDILKGILFFHVTSATLDWLLNTPNPTQRASTCSQSSRRTSKTREKTPTKVRDALILQIQKVERLIPTSICQLMAGEMKKCWNTEGLCWVCECNHCYHSAPRCLCVVLRAILHNLHVAENKQGHLNVIKYHKLAKGAWLRLRE